MTLINFCLLILRNGRSLSFKQSFDLATDLVDASFETQVEIISLFQKKGETKDEILGFVKAFQQMYSLPNGFRLPHCFDVCGTGGDGLNTFNASTTAAFIASAAGVLIAKSGNGAMSGRCGSSDVLSTLHIKLATTSKEAYSCHQEGLVFIATKEFFPEFRKLTEARKKVGGLTIGNLVGPLLNPLGVRQRVLGVPSKEKALLMAQVLHKVQAYGSLVVTGENGEDEITPCGKTTIYKVKKLGIEVSILDPQRLYGFTSPLKEVSGGTHADNATFIKGILGGEKGPRAKMAIMNAAAIISIAHGIPYEKAIEKAQNAISSGSAMRVLQNVQTHNR